MTSRRKRIEKREKRLSMTMSKVAEDAAKEQDESIYARALSWTLDQSQEESELEKVISGIPKFAHSRKVKDPMDVLTKAVKGSSLRPNLYRDVTTLLINATIPGFLHGHKKLDKEVRKRREVMCLEAIFFIPGGIEKILRRVSEHLEDKNINRGFSSALLENERAYEIAQSPEFWQPREEEEQRTKASESVIIAARCATAVMASRLRARICSTPNEQFEEILNEHSFLLKVLNRFLKKVALEFIDVETDIFLPTVKIVTEKLQLNSAKPSLRVEFDGHMTSLINLALNGETPIVRRNAEDLRFVLANLRNPPSGNGSPPPPMTQTDSPAAMSPVSQAPPPMVTSPPPGDVYISMPSTPSAETHPLMPMSSHQAHPRRSIPLLDDRGLSRLHH